jgi:hypothetical protein
LQKLGSILARLKLPGPGPLQLRQIETALARTFGARAASLRVASFRRGRLVIEAGSAASAFELQAFARGAALRSLRGQPGLEALAELVFRVGTVRKGAPAGAGRSRETNGE